MMGKTTNKLNYVLNKYYALNKELSVGSSVHLTLSLSPMHTVPSYIWPFAYKVCALAACSPPGSVCLY